MKPVPPAMMAANVAVASAHVLLPMTTSAARHSPDATKARHRLSSAEGATATGGPRTAINIRTLFSSRSAKTEALSGVPARAAPTA